MLMLCLVRKMATISARPTATSAAATVMTKKTKIWPLSTLQVHAGKRHKRQVGGVEHQLDRHEDDQRVAADRARPARPCVNKDCGER